MPCCISAKNSDSVTAHATSAPSYCSVKKVAAIATLFFVLSGAGFGLLLHFNLDQYLPITYATAGVSFLTLVISTALIYCCESRSKDWDPRAFRKSIIAKAEGEIRDWLETEAPVAVGNFTHELESEALHFIDASTDPTHPLGFSTEKRHELNNKIFLLIHNLMESFQKHYTTSYEAGADKAEFIKKFLWAQCVDSDGDFTPTGDALKKMKGHFAVLMPQKDLSCNLIYNQKTGVIDEVTGFEKDGIQGTSGLFALLLTEIRDIMNKS